MGNRIYVGNLPFNSTSEDVRGAFAAHGAVEDVRVVMDRETGRSRGLAFVTMASDEDAQRAIQAMNGAMFGDRPLRVNEAVEKGARPSFPSPRPPRPLNGGPLPPMAEPPPEPGDERRRRSQFRGDRRGPRIERSDDDDDGHGRGRRRRW